MVSKSNRTQSRELLLEFDIARTRYTILNKMVRAADSTQISMNVVYGLPVLGPKPSVCIFCRIFFICVAIIKRLR